MGKRLKSANPGREIQLEFEGHRIPAREGETVAASLLAAGTDIFARGVKYHRARGPFCLAGRCSHCVMRIDGEPNVFSCLTASRDGMRVERQNAFPSVSHDLFATIDWMYPRGIDHHSLFAGVPVVEKVVARVAREMAGLGTLPDGASSPEASYLELETEVLVVGGGVSGLAAASAAAGLGAKVTLVDEKPEVGGRLHADLGGSGLAASWKAEKLEALQEADAHLLSSTFAFGLFLEEGFLVAAKAPNRRLLVIRPKAVVVATGSSEMLPLFPNNDLPGIFGARALARLIQREGVLPGERAVVCGDGEEAEGIAALLRSAGCEVVAEVGLTPGEKGNIVRARGRGRVAGAILQDSSGAERRVRCDLIAVADHRSAFLDLARHAGAGVEWKEPEGFGVVVGTGGATGVPGLFACGETTGGCTLEDSARQGAAAGASAAAFLRRDAS